MATRRRYGRGRRASAVRVDDGPASEARRTMPISDYLRDLRARVGTTLLAVPSVTGLIFDDEGRVLLVQHANGGVWLLPGGAIDPDETPQDAVVREVWEETGLDVAPIAL